MGETRQILPSTGFSWWGHLLEDEGMLGAAGVGCVLLFQTYTWFSWHPMYLPLFIFLLRASSVVPTPGGMQSISSEKVPPWKCHVL